MVGSKGARGPPGPPGKCGCSSLSSPPFSDYSSRGNYPKVPAVRNYYFVKDKTLYIVFHHRKLKSQVNVKGFYQI